MLFYQFKLADAYQFVNISWNMKKSTNHWNRVQNKRCAPRQRSIILYTAKKYVTHRLMFF